MNLQKNFLFGVAGVALVVCITFGILFYKQKEKVSYIESLLGTFKRDMAQSGYNQNASVVYDKERKNWTLVQNNLKDSVIQIFSDIVAFNWLEPYKSPEQFKATGTGFFIDDQGSIITNAHVVDQAKLITIQIPSFGKRRFDVDIIGVAVDRDLALLKLKESDVKEIKDTLKKLSYLKLGDSDQVHRSDEIMALGYPLGQQSLKSTTGIVSGREHLAGQHMIQTSAPINPGNSGGPSINFAGEVVGVNTANVPSAQNVGYFIPSNEVKLFLHHLKNYSAENKSEKIKFLRKPYLGILFNAASESMTSFLGNPLPGGLYVAGVQRGSPLKKAGVEIGDMIYEIDGHKLDVFGELNVPWSEDKISIIDYVARLKIGDKVNLLSYRKGKPRGITLTFKETELAPIRLMNPGYEKIDYEILGGMVIMPLALNHLPLLGSESPELIQYLDMQSQLDGAIVITHVLSDSQADRARTIRQGVIIKEANGVVVKTLDEFRDAVKKSLDTKFLTIKTNQNIFIALPFDKILAEEYGLSRTYFYPITPFISDLMKRGINTKPEQKVEQKVEQKTEKKSEQESEKKVEKKSEQKAGQKSEKRTEKKSEQKVEQKLEKKTEKNLNTPKIFELPKVNMSAIKPIVPVTKP